MNIINNPPENDDFILKDIVELLVVVLTLTNKSLVGLTSEQFSAEVHNYLEISFERIAKMVS